VCGAGDAGNERVSSGRFNGLLHIHAEVDVFNSVCIVLMA